MCLNRSRLIEIINGRALSTRTWNDISSMFHLIDKIIELSAEWHGVIHCL